MSIRSEAAKAIKGALEGAIPDLAGKVHVWHALPTDAATAPCLGIIPGRMEYQPAQEEVLWGEDTTKALLDMGDLVGTWEFRLLAKTTSEREKLEDAVMATFFQTEGKPGVLVSFLEEFEIQGVRTGFDAPVGCTLEQQTWREEFAFSQKRWSWMDVEVNIPLLILRDRVYDMDSLRVALTNDLTSASPTIDAEVQIGESGTLTPV